MVKRSKQYLNVFFSQKLFGDGNGLGWGEMSSIIDKCVHVHALEKEMATHSSVLAWRIPGTGELGGLPSVGSQSRTRLQ